MSDTLVIRLLAHALSSHETSSNDRSPVAQWMLADVTGSRLGMVMEGSLAEAAPLGVTRKVIVLIPGTEVVAAEPMLPIKRGAQLEQVARYALEESLAGDIDELHVSIGKRTTAGGTPMVLIQHRAMAQCFAALNEANIVADAIYAETEVIPTVPGGNCMVIDSGLLYLRRGGLPGTVLDVHPLHEALTLAIGGTNEVTAVNLIYVSQSDFQRDGDAIEAWRERVPNLQIKTLPEGPLPLFALQAAKFTALNLMSGPYARKKSWNKTFAPWRIAAVLFGVAILSYLAASGLQFWRLSKAEAQLDQQIRQLVTQTLPGASTTDTRNARKQFESRLSALQSGQGGSGLLNGLNVLSSALQQLPEMRIDALAFRTKVLDLRITVPNVDALDRIQHLAAEQGVTAEIQSATPRDNKVEGRLQLKASNI